MMMMLPLAKVSFLWTLVVVLWLLIALALILIVLIQKGRGGGLNSAFGGGGGANSLLGTKTGDFLTWVTISLVALFLVMAVVMGKFMRPDGSSNLVDTAVQTQPQMPVAPPADDAAAQVEQTADTVAPEAQDAAQDAAQQAAEVTPPAAAEVPATPVTPAPAGN